MVMPRPSRNKILRKVLSHLHKDIKEQNKGAKEDEELSAVIKKKPKTISKTAKRSGSKKK